MNKSALLKLAQFAPVAILGACASTDLSKAVKPYKNADLAIAAQEVRAIDADSTDGVWVLMEKGSILKASGNFAESQSALMECNNRMDQLLKDAGEEAVAVGGLAGAGAVLTDDRQCTYVGALYEAQLVCALQAMNALQLSSLGDAQAAISLLRNRVDEAKDTKRRVEVYLATKREENEAKRAEQQQKLGEKYNDYSDGLKYLPYDDAQKAAYTSWADTSVGIGLFLAELVDRESGKSGEFLGYMDRLATDAAAQRYRTVDYTRLAAETREAANQLRKAPAGETTYVIVERGIAPARILDAEEMNKSWAKALEVQLPGLDGGSGSDSVSVAVGNQTVPIRLVTDMRLLKGNEFAVCYPDIRYRAVLGKLIKESAKIAGVATAVASKDRSTQLIGLGVALAGAVASALQGADLRSWDCLPLTYEVAAIKTPASGEITVTCGGKAQKVRVVPGVSNTVLIGTIRDGHCSIYSAPVKPVAATN